MTERFSYESAVLLCIGMVPVCLLTMRHWVHLWYLLLLAVGLTYCLSHRPKITSQDLLPTLILATPLLAVLIAQAFRGEVLMRSFDSPSRLFCAIPIYLLIRDKFTSGELKPSAVLNVLTLGTTVALLTLPLFLNDARTSFYGGRIATTRVDTNTLGSLIGIFLIVVSLGAWRVSKEILRASRWRVNAVTLIFFVTALVLGLDMLLQTQSRGAWIGFGCVLVIASSLLLIAEQKKYWKLALLVMTVVALIAANTLSRQHLERMKSIPAEVVSWILNNQQETSGGIRLSMIQMSIDLFLEKPVSGYGERGYAQKITDEKYTGIYGAQTINDMAKAGPHNGILDQALENGTFGLLASLILYLAPVVALFKIQQRVNNESIVSLTFKVLGVAFFIQILVLQFTINPYGLRMLATFNALMLALFMAYAASQRKPSAE